MSVATAPSPPSTRKSTAPAAPGWRTWRSRVRRWPVALTLLCLACVIILVALGGRSSTGQPLDPESASPTGSKALASLLHSQGVSSQKTRSFDEVIAHGAGTTVLVVAPEWLNADQLQRLRSSTADVVLLQPSEAALTLAPGVQAGSAAPLLITRPYQPGHCELEAGRLAGVIEVDDARGYLAATLAAAAPFVQEAAATAAPAQPAQAATSWCYPVGEEPGSGGVRGSFLLARVHDRRHTVTVVGSASLLTNQSLANQGNASLAMGVLGANPTLVWYQPEPSLGQGSASLSELAPRGVVFALLALLIVAVVLALVQGRRLGPVITEPLPVVVRAAETAEGRARLYQKAGARNRAAEALRRQARSRLSQRYRLGRHAQREQLLAALQRESTTTPAELEQLLYGPEPRTEAELVQVARGLHQLTDPVAPSSVNPHHGHR